MEELEVRFVARDGPRGAPADLDVEVRLHCEGRFSATFFATTGVRERNPCDRVYRWAAELIVMDTPTHAKVRCAVRELLAGSPFLVGTEQD